MVRNSTLCYNVSIYPGKNTIETFDLADTLNNDSGAYDEVYSYLDSLECNVREEVVEKLLLHIRQAY